DKEKIKSYKPPIGEPCLSCRYFKICGGRCLYTHMERLWGEDGMRAICEVSKFIIDSILERMSIIEKFLDEGMITEEQLIYPKYNNTIEIMP
ncbi:MAG: putative peptide-modifying radical SAM/SPASM domain-containing protein, partial [Thermoprotei archaeon]